VKICSLSRVRERVGVRAIPLPLAGEGRVRAILTEKR